MPVAVVMEKRVVPGLFGVNELQIPTFIWKAIDWWAGSRRKIESILATSMNVKALRTMERI